MTIQITKPETPKVRKQLVERPNIQTLSLKAIVADAAFQSRIETDPSHVLTFDEMIREGHAIHPVTVFWTGERYILADGFHRYYAHLKRGLDSIQAVVIFGSERDAMIHSAGANRLSIKPPTDADRKKAVMMLLEDEEWRSKSDSVIARYTGVGSGATVGRYRLECLVRNGDEEQIAKLRRKRQRRGFRRNHCSPPTPENVRPQTVGVDSRLPILKARHTEDVSEIVHVLARRGFLVVASNYPSACMISAYLEPVLRIAFIRANANDVMSIRKAILDVLLVRKARCDGGRAIVLGYLEVASKPVLEIVELAKPLGVEFMTPEEFIDSFAATDESAPADEPMLD